MQQKNERILVNWLMALIYWQNNRPVFWMTNEV